MATATVVKTDVVEWQQENELGTIRIPMETEGCVVDGTGGLQALRPITLAWDNDGNPEQCGGLGIVINCHSLGGDFLGHDLEGLPDEMRGFFLSNDDDPHTRKHSRAWVLMGLASGKGSAILHRRSDAEYMGRQLHEASPELWQLTEEAAFHKALPPYMAEWVRLTAYLLNHGVPRALIVTCKEYLERRKPD